MEEILACRVCLSTDVKLYDMFKYQLVSSYETLTGSEITSSDGLPHQMCTYCGTLLLKCTSFLERCRNTQDLLNYAILQQDLVTTDSIRNIECKSQNFYSTYYIKHNPVVSIDNSSIKEEPQELVIDELVIKTESSDDEVPLSVAAKKQNKNIKKTRKSEPKYDIKNEDDTYEEAPEFNDEFDNDSDDNNGNDDLDVEIRTLTKEEQIEEVQARKNSHNYLNSFYKCDECFKGFMTEGTYKNHMERHDPRSGAYRCCVCGARTACARSLRAHNLAAHARRYVCKRCGHVSKSSYRAKEHSKWHDGFMYVCDVCGATFSKSTSHLTHIRLQHPSGNACEICGESFIGEYGLNMHKKKAHRTSTEHPKVCLTCGVQFRNTVAMETHLNTSKGTSCCSLRPCAFCGINFTNESLLKDHLKQHQREEHVKCVECDRQFANSRTYAVHYQQFHRGATRRRDRNVRQDSAVCEVCGKKCKSKATLIYHQRTHTGEKPFECTECPKRFSIYQRLQIHLRTHTGERPFKCSHCPKAFKHKAALNRHDRVHTGVKPYGCQYCGKTFSQSNSMKTHVRTVHLKLPAPYRNNRKNKPD